MKGKTSREERIQAMAFLRERYPNTFHAPGEEKPLEVGIKGKLIAQVKDNLPQGVSLRAIYVALHYYCCTKEYKKARKTVGTPRLNLAGEVAGQVTEADLELGVQHDAKKNQEKADRLAMERALEANRREKQERLEKAAAKKAAKEAAEKALAEKATKKWSRPNHKTNAISSAKTSFRPGGMSAPRTSTKPTIVVRKKKTLNLPGMEKKPDLQ
jgi:sRNA-binding protein